MLENHLLLKDLRTHDVNGKSCKTVLMNIMAGSNVDNCKIVENVNM